MGRVGRHWESKWENENTFTKLACVQDYDGGQMSLSRVTIHGMWPVVTRAWQHNLGFNAWYRTKRYTSTNRKVTIIFYVYEAEIDVNFCAVGNRSLVKSQTFRQRKCTTRAIQTPMLRHNQVEPSFKQDQMISKAIWNCTNACCMKVFLKESSQPR